MTRVDPQAKALVVARLRERRETGEPIGDEVRRVARELGVGARSVWRWVAEFTEPDSGARADRYELTDADLDEFERWQGNVTAVHRELHAGRPGGLSVRRLQRAFAAQLTPGQRAGLVEGAEGRRRYEVYLRWDPPARNAMWEGDHVELPVLVLPPRAQRPVKPWATLFLDGYSRLVMGWAISRRPSSAEVLAALRGGIVVDPARGPFGGVPAVLRTDHGLEFTATALRRSCAALGIEPAPVPPYTPHLKGKVERLNRTLVQEFLSGLPFATDGPRAADGTLLGPDADPMSLALFVDRFADGSPATTPPGCTPRWAPRRCSAGNGTRPPCARSGPSSCAGCCWPTSSARSTATACTSAGSGSSLRSSTGWSASRCRSATCPTTCGASRSSAAMSGCARRTRKKR